MKRILLLLLVLVGMGAAVAYYQWNKPHQNMTTAKTDVAIAAPALFEEYNGDVTGKVKEVTNDEGSVKVSLEAGGDFGVRCELSSADPNVRTQFSPGESVTFKGTCSGLNFDVQLSNCVEIR
jgi:hypothetical protein